MADGEFDFIIKQNDWGDREPLRAVLEQIVVDENGEPILDGEGNLQWEAIDLTGCTIHIVLVSREEIEGSFMRLKTSPMDIVDAKEGRVEYAFENAGEGEGEEADLAYAGGFDLQFEILGPNEPGKRGRQMVPNEDYYGLKVEADRT